jgi:hypothetical protein
MPRYYVSAHLCVIEPASAEEFSALLERLRDVLPEMFHASAFGTQEDYVVGATIPAENEEEAREAWFAVVDRVLDRVGLAELSRYATRLRFEPLP